MTCVDLPTLISRRKSQTGDSLRTMEARAAAAGNPISTSMLSSYMRGEVGKPPTMGTIHAIAAALDVSPPEVVAAVEETWRLETTSPTDEPWHVKRWRALADKRSDAERMEMLVVVEAMLRMRDLDGPDD